MHPRRKFRIQRLAAHLFLATGLAVLLTGIVHAQSQLPGTQLTTDKAHDLRPAWSPDGQTIAFQSARSGNYDILLMDADGGNQTYLVQDPSDDRRPAWSPDGGRVAFDSDRSGGRDIWMVDAAGGNMRQLTAGPGEETFPSFSPDGTQVAFYSYAGGVLDLWLITLDDTLPDGKVPAPQKLTNSLADERQNQCTFACHTAGWSPDGSQIVYTGMNHTQIWVVGVDGSNAHVVAGGGAYEHFPQWLADGRILFLSERITDQQEPVNDVWVMDADGSNATLLHEAVHHGGPLEFRHSDDMVSFHSPRTGNFDIYTTVLGQAQTPTTPEATTAPEAAFATQAAPAAEPTTAPQTEPSRDLSRTWLALLGVAVVGGGGVALYLLRRMRAG